MGIFQLAPIFGGKLLKKLCARRRWNKSFMTKHIHIAYLCYNGVPRGNICRFVFLWLFIGNELWYPVYTGLVKHIDFMFGVYFD